MLCPAAGNAAENARRNQGEHVKTDATAPAHRLHENASQVRRTAGPYVQSGAGRPPYARGGPNASAHGVCLASAHGVACASRGKRTCGNEPLKRRHPPRRCDRVLASAIAYPRPAPPARREPRRCYSEEQRVRPGPAIRGAGRGRARWIPQAPAPAPRELDTPPPPPALSGAHTPLSLSGRRRKSETAVKRLECLRLTTSWAQPQATNQAGECRRRCIRARQ